MCTPRSLLSEQAFDSSIESIILFFFQKIVRKKENVKSKLTGCNVKAIFSFDSHFQGSTENSAISTALQQSLPDFVHFGVRQSFDCT